MAKDDTTEIVDSISLPEKDPFPGIAQPKCRINFLMFYTPGRYLMESSDKFDDFMKSLGVGMIKRKLANSVVPINEVRYHHMDHADIVAFQVMIVKMFLQVVVFENVCLGGDY